MQFSMYEDNAHPPQSVRTSTSTTADTSSPLLILPAIQCLLDKYPLISHHPRNPIIVLVNVLRGKYNLMSWINHYHTLYPFTYHLPH